LSISGENNLSFIETSALDASNVELAFQNILTGMTLAEHKADSILTHNSQKSIVSSHPKHLINPSPLARYPLEIVSRSHKLPTPIPSQATNVAEQLVFFKLDWQWNHLAARLHAQY
jgi:hypothetical protein